MNVKVEEKDREVDMCKALRDMTDKAKNAGRAEGRAEGQKEKSIEIARKLLAAGYPKDEVLQLTGVVDEEL